MKNDLKDKLPKKPETPKVDTGKIYLDYLKKRAKKLENKDGKKKS